MDLPAANISTWVAGKSMPRAQYIDKLEEFFGAPIRKLAAELNEAPIEKVDDIEAMILSTQLTYKGELISAQQKLKIISMIKIILDK
jgi:transcriptional regulator with XRE-family HTH domain